MRGRARASQVGRRAAHTTIAAAIAATAAALAAGRESAATVSTASLVDGTPTEDVAAITEDARRDLGAAVRITTVDTFVLAGAPSLSAAGFEKSVSLTRRALEAFYAGRFARHPSRPVAVWLFPTAKPYQAWCKAKWGTACISIYGFFLSDERRLVMNVGPGLGTLTHELVHPILRADFPEAPTWIDEGIASLYEAPVIAKPGSIRGIKNWRLPRLMRALASKEERAKARLERLFGLTDEIFRGDGEDLHYALARYVCQWLDGRGWLWPFYHQWRDDHAADPTGARAFRAVTGLEPEAAREPFERWVKKL